jgi:hypothetical protein
MKNGMLTRYPVLREYRSLKVLYRTSKGFEEQGILGIE